MYKSELKLMYTVFLFICYLNVIYPCVKNHLQMRSNFKTAAFIIYMCVFFFLAVFLTGSDRIPILGMKCLKLVIQPTGGGEEYLPVAHTCFNLLDLPKYTDKEILKSKLIQAIDHYEGFSLV